MQPSAELQRSQQHAVNGEGEAVAEEDRERPARGRRRRNDRTFAQPEPQAQVPEHQPQTQQEIAEPPVEDVAVEQPEPQNRRQRLGPAMKRPVQENDRSEEHTSELQSLMRRSYAGYCFKHNQTTSNSKCAN